MRDKQIIGIDGEGWTDARGKHRYTYLAACTTDAMISECYAPNGLKAEDVFEWLLELPERALLVGYSLGYDKTKWLESMPDERIWALMHPESHPGDFGPEPIQWGDYELNAIATKFTVRNLVSKTHKCSVWDIFKFFQCSFVKALETWSVGTQEERDTILAMKEKRGGFQGINENERMYCRNECQLLAVLAHKLLDSHEDVGIPLKTYFGPGSTASIMLDRCNAKKQVVKVRKAMVEPVACAFFGGRFETSRVGKVTCRPVYSYDIASAYPYAIAQLPCLRHGRWEHVRYKGGYNAGNFRLSDSLNIWPSLYRYTTTPQAQTAWGALPHRLEDGNIVFPLKDAPGGWAWLSEIAAARQLALVMCYEAWRFEPRCDCPPPFRLQVANWYNDRLRWGKDGKGLTLKLGLNSMYGKRAQHVGNGKYRCMVAAGLITSMCRAMILQAIAQAKDPWSILSVATDGILSTERLELPKPIELGTGATGKALGSWEEKIYPDGVFLIRPGLRFSLSDVATIKETAARGLGVKVLHENRRKVLDMWNKFPGNEVFIQQPTIFHGAKSCIRPGHHEITQELIFKRDGKYGTWTKPEPRRVGYEAKPKRESIVWDGSWSKPDRNNCRLLPHETPAGGLPSFPYQPGLQTELKIEVEEIEAIGEEQDGGERETGI